MTDRGDRSLVGVCGDETATATAAASAIGVEHVTGTAAELLETEPDVLVTVGESAFCSLAATQPTVPVLPVAAGPGVRSLPQSALERGLETALAGGGERVRHPVLAVTVGDEERARVVKDAMLVTAEPARISAFSVGTAARRLPTFRADGVVVATPTGSHGYARRVDGPILAPGTDVVAVTPVAPFSTDSDRWVFPAEDLTVRVERDEAPVELVGDDRRLCSVPHDVPITLAQVGAVEVVVLPEHSSDLAPTW